MPEPGLKQRIEKLKGVRWSWEIDKTDIITELDKTIAELRSLWVSDDDFTLGNVLKALDSSRESGSPVPKGSGGLRAKSLISSAPKEEEKP